MFSKNSKPLWEHVFTITVLFVFIITLGEKKNHRALGAYINSNYKIVKENL